MRVAVVARVVGVVVAGGVVGTAYVHRPRGFECVYSESRPLQLNPLHAYTYQEYLVSHPEHGAA